MPDGSGQDAFEIGLALLLPGGTGGALGSMQGDLRRIDEAVAASLAEVPTLIERLGRSGGQGRADRLRGHAPTPQVGPPGAGREGAGRERRGWGGRRAGKRRLTRRGAGVGSPTIWLGRDRLTGAGGLPGPGLVDEESGRSMRRGRSVRSEIMSAGRAAGAGRRAVMEVVPGSVARPRSGVRERYWAGASPGRAPGEAGVRRLSRCRPGIVGGGPCRMVGLFQPSCGRTLDWRSRGLRHQGWTPEARRARTRRVGGGVA